MDPSYDSLPPAFVGVRRAETPLGCLDHALFAPGIAQWFADDISSPWGVRTSTFEALAWEVLDVPSGILVTSDLAERPDES